jgi:uncharacterized membrane protein YhaH (DUF805 family)
MNVLLRPWRRYADFEGRSRRTEYFLFILINWVVLGGIMFIGGALGGYEWGVRNAPVSTITTVFFGLAGLFWLVSFIPALALQFRRAHDMGHTAWVLLAFIIPLFGLIVALMLLFGPGTDGYNNYGPDPRYGDDQEDDADYAPVRKPVARVV